jgi:anthranilate phosphoribosyltransferase
MDGGSPDALVGAFLVALKIKGAEADELAGAVRAMLARALPLNLRDGDVLDTCGTGGDGQGTLNLSTAAAVLVAAMGVPVAKHGNRSASSRCSSADVVEELGIPIDVPPARQGRVLHEAGIAFLFAQAHHPALRHAAAARRELGIRTIFNALGPLANPARATRQLVGVYDDALRPLFAHALSKLGVEEAWIVRGEDGLDEVSPVAPTRVSELSGGTVRERIVCPEDFGIRRSSPGAIAGGDARDNARAIEAIFDGEPHPARDAVALNAAAGLVVARGVPLREAARRAFQTLDDGLAKAKLDQWRRASAAAKVP